MSKVYIVERGEYSDHEIVGVFSANEAAELFAKRYRQWHYGAYDDPEEVHIIEFDLDDPKLQTDKTLFLVCYWHGNGKTTVWHDFPWSITNGEIRDGIGFGAENGNNDFTETVVLAETQEKALKIGVDRIMQHIAEKEGVA
jgi:hypothetical protein